MATLAEARPGRANDFLTATRRLAASVWEHAGMRLELLSLELAEERTRLVGIMVATGTIVMSIAMTVAFIGVTVLVAAWDSPHRVWVAVAVAAGYAISGVIAWAALRHLLQQSTPLFRHSLAEWRRDVDRIRPGIESGP